jgi:hypothetical protein
MPTEFVPLSRAPSYQELDSSIVEPDYYTILPVASSDSSIVEPEPEPEPDYHHFFDEINYFDAINTRQASRSLDEMVAECDITSILSRKKSKKRQQHSKLSAILVEEEIEKRRLRSKLQYAEDRLEYEKRRREEAESRVEHAEMRAKEVIEVMMDIRSIARETVEKIDIGKSWRRWHDQSELINGYADAECRS